MKKKSMTLIEVIIAAFILSALFAGFFATFTGTRRYVNRANRRLIASNLAKAVLNNLYRDVREDTWNAGNLAITGVPVPLPNYNIDVPGYGSVADPNEYIVDAVAGQEYRQVTVTINHPSE